MKATTTPRDWVDRYHQIGLSRNPFALELAMEPEAVPGPGHGFVPRGFGSAPDPGGSILVQIVGDRGFGKTTQLNHWRRQRPGPYHYVPAAPYRARWHNVPVEPIVYGDEIDRLAGPVRRQWFAALARAEATAVIGTHRDLGRGARRAGLDVATHVLEPVGLHELSRIVRVRIEAVALDHQAVPTILDDDELAIVHQRSAGSIRRAEILCHQLVADRADRRGSG